mmetsp:Transcript_36578/g.60580  ORF Transcript_36578/g.60580 Transcript_36578/m.60580 type:complete len:222 (+) Transcript_36578:103-768(+)
MSQSHVPNQSAKKRVSFGHVNIAEFVVTIDDSKLPSDGLSPLGLGEWQHDESFILDQYESARNMSDDDKPKLAHSSGACIVASRRGVRRIDDFERRGLLVGYLGKEDPVALAILEAVEAANREIRGQKVSVYERDHIYEEETAAGSGWASLNMLSDKPRSPLYTTAEEGASRDGMGGGFHERDEEEEARRKTRAISEKAATETRKAERRRCAGCRRFACIC